MDDVWWVVLLKIVAILVLTFLSATFSGLDLGLMSLSPGQLELMIKEGVTGDVGAKLKASRAKQILPVRRDGNLLLCTVLLGNVAVNSCMAVFLDSFTGGIAAFVVTTFLVVTFGEIIPQSLCYKHSLLIGSKLLPILKFFRILFYPINKPVALLLDRFFGDSDHATVMMNRNQMVAAVDYQMKKDPKRLNRTTSGLLKGALQSSEVFVKDVMVPIEDVFCLEANAIVDAAMLKTVSKAGFSKLPVVDYVMDDYESRLARVMGFLHVSDLLGIDTAEALPVKALFLACRDKASPFRSIGGGETLLNLLRTLKSANLEVVCVRQSAGNEDPYWFHSGIVVAQDLLTAIAQDDLKARTGSKASAEQRRKGVEVRAVKETLVEDIHTETLVEGMNDQAWTAPSPPKVAWS